MEIGTEIFAISSWRQVTVQAHVFAGARILGAFALLPLLGGCVAAAAVAVPAMTAIGVVTEDGRTNAPAVGGEAEVFGGGPSPDEIELTALMELPAPIANQATSEWRSFVSYSLEQAASRAADDEEPISSALLAPESAAMLLPRRLPCQADESAVILDLDQGDAAFTPGTAMQVAPGLTDGLARLRDAGIVVMWISRLDANHITEVADALKISGLDPDGADPILLLLGENNRKQLLRERVGETACVVALAGDQRSDFDEMFDYLRDPEASHDFDVMLGSGWFLAPAPLQ